MLDPVTWLPQAQQLKLGERRKVAHDCGNDSMIVSHKHDGFSAWCFRCHDKGWHPKPPPTLAERLANRQTQAAADATIEADPRPPQPANFDVASWPLAARVWLFKAGLFVEDIAKLGAYYHPRTRRVVLPVFEGDRLAFWQARCVEGDGPKYLSSPVPKGSVVPRYGAGRAVTLVEDILSAFRVGMEGEGWSLMGTELSTQVLSKLLQDGRPVQLWLDPDDAGQSAAATILRTLENTGIKCRNIISDKDPKLLSRAEVRRLCACSSE